MSSAQQAEDNKSAVLYVGNLDRRANESLLKQIFETIGHVKRCKLIAEHAGTEPYCFVEFEDHPTAVQALEAMNGRKVYSKSIRVSWATAQGASKKDTSGHFHIFVGDLSPDVDADQLKEFFGKCGAVSEARVVCDSSNGKSRGFGFVAFPTKMEAQQAIDSQNGKMLGSRSIRTNWATRRVNGRDGMPGAGANSRQLSYEEVSQQTSPYNCTVYVGNLGAASGVTEDKLRQSFSTYGPVLEVRFFPDKGYAFIKFASHDQAANAIVSVNGTPIFGSAVKCSWGKEPNEHAIAMQQQQYFQYYYNQFSNQSYLAAMQYGMGYPYGAAGYGPMMSLPPGYGGPGAAAGGGVPGAGMPAAASGMGALGQMVPPYQAVPGAMSSRQAAYHAQ